MVLVFKSILGGYFIDLILAQKRYPVLFPFCKDALAACNYLPQSREKIIAALFKALNSTNNELQEAGEACMRKVSAISHCFLVVRQGFLFFHILNSKSWFGSWFLSFFFFLLV